MGMDSPQPVMAGRIDQIHQLYCRLTGQNLSLRFDRQRLWYEFLHAGFSAAQLTQVIGYLQKEISQGRRNVGALKLSNLLQLDRFEEDLNIGHVRLRPPAAPQPTITQPKATLSVADQERGRQLALQRLRKLKENLVKGLI
jgi:hypothetical protein